MAAKDERMKVIPVLNNYYYYTQRLSTSCACTPVGMSPEPVLRRAVCGPLLLGVLSDPLLLSLQPSEPVLRTVGCS